MYFINSDVLRDQAEGYVRAIQWILHYYYNGVCSWSWFYPHHYAPYVSDIKNFSTLELTYELDQPFLPYEQLLAVLPAASKELLPQALRSLMVSANSPIIEFYPCNFLVGFRYSIILVISLIPVSNALFRFLVLVGQKWEATRMGGSGLDSVHR